MLQRPAVAPLIVPLDLSPVKKTYLRRQVGGVAPDCSQRGQRQRHKPTFDYLLHVSFEGRIHRKRLPLSIILLRIASWWSGGNYSRVTDDVIGPPLERKRIRKDVTLCDRDGEPKGLKNADCSKADD